MNEERQLRTAGELEVRVHTYARTCPTSSIMIIYTKRPNSIAQLKEVWVLSRGRNRTSVKGNSQFKDKNEEPDLQSFKLQRNLIFFLIASCPLPSQIIIFIIRIKDSEDTRLCTLIPRLLDIDAL